MHPNELMELICGCEDYDDFMKLKEVKIYVFIGSMLTDLYFNVFLAKLWYNGTLNKRTYVSVAEDTRTSLVLTRHISSDAIKRNENE